MRFHRLIAATAAWLVLVCTLASAHAEKRVALVGNAAYRYTDKLDNPVNDAQAMACRPSPFCRSGEAIAFGGWLQERYRPQSRGHPRCMVVRAT